MLLMHINNRLIINYKYYFFHNLYPGANFLADIIKNNYFSDVIYGPSQKIKISIFIYMECVLIIMAKS